MQNKFERTSSVSMGQYRSGKGEIFDLSWSKWKEPFYADYWMYFIDVKHDKWAHTYTVFATKSKYPDEEGAKMLATSYCVEEIKKILDDVSIDGPHLVWYPLNCEGWAML